MALRDLRVTGVIGRGTSGIVHSALHLPTGALFALKVIPLDVREEVRKRIIGELRCLHASLHCPAIVPLHAAFLSEGSVAIVLEHMDCGSLAELLSAHGPLCEAHARVIAARVLLGLRFLHTQLNIIHRDLKPSNLLLNARGEVKISDVGVSGQLAHGRAESTSWLGTARYMAPERIRGGTYGAREAHPHRPHRAQDRAGSRAHASCRLFVRLLGAGHHAAGVLNRCGCALRDAFRTKAAVAHLHRRRPLSVRNARAGAPGLLGAAGAPDGAAAADAAQGAARRRQLFRAVPRVRGGVLAERAGRARQRHGARAARVA